MRYGPRVTVRRSRRGSRCAVVQLQMYTAEKDVITSKSFSLKYLLLTYCSKAVSLCRRLVISFAKLPCVYTRTYSTKKTSDNHHCDSLQLSNFSVRSSTHVYTGCKYNCCTKANCRNILYMNLGATLTYVTLSWNRYLHLLRTLRDKFFRAITTYHTPSFFKTILWLKLPHLVSHQRMHQYIMY